jgi:Dos2-interacting transcription regulator of RNA-Pol-II
MSSAAQNINITKDNDDDDDDDDTTSTTKKLFLQWQQECMAAATSNNNNKNAKDDPKEDTSDDNNNMIQNKNDRVFRRRKLLYQEALRFFASSSITNSTTTSSTSSSSSSMDSSSSTNNSMISHEQALALLIQALQPAVAVVVPAAPRLAALACLQGALTACCVRHRGSGGGGLSPALVELLGTFLLQHIGPLDLNNNHKNDAMSVDDLVDLNDVAINNDLEDWEQDIRDASLEAMTRLLQAMTPNTTTLQPADTAAAAAAPIGNTLKSNETSMIALACRLAQSAVQRRCAEKEYNEDDEEYYMQQQQDDHRSSLSLLPRSKRSLCFDVLRAAVDCWNAILLACSDNNISVDSQQKRQQENDDDDSLRNFALFCIASLVGESDPRCLLQLLQLLSSLQAAYAATPAAETTTTSMSGSPSSFPIVPLFNAVAPYYPIQFTPPPNNIHGITKQALQTALWDVLSCTKNDNDTHDHASHEPSSMFSLTLGIVLERLVPPDPDDPQSTPEELVEALADLTSLLQLSPSDTATAEMPVRASSSLSSSTTSSRLDWMDTTALRQLSDTLRTVHDRASLVVAKAARSGEGTTTFTTRINKQVADTCRTLVGQIALECETNDSKKHKHWQVFVADLVQKQLTPKLLLLGDYGSRAAIAYMACLAGCGGIKTLRLVLQCGLHPLINVVVNYYASTAATRSTSLEHRENAGAAPNKDKKDDASIAIAISGIVAFLVSTHVTLSKVQQQGIALSPHPLQPHGTRMLSVFAKIILNDNYIADDIRIASIRAVEAVLLTVPAQVLLEENVMNDAVQANSGQTTTMETIVQLIQVMTDAVVILDADDDNNTTSNSNGSEEWTKACAETLGRVLGKVLQDSPQKDDDNDTDSGNSSNDSYVGILQDNQTIRGFLLDSVLTALLTSASVPTAREATLNNRNRYDYMTLAMAASSKSSAAIRILQPLLQELRALIQNQNQETEASINVQQKEAACAQTIAFILSNGGGASAAIAFQKDSMTTILLDIIKSLASKASMAKEEQGGMEAMFRMSKLNLPPTEEDENLMLALIQKGRDLLLPILSVYSFATIASHRERLGTAVAKVLPPLNASDTVRLSLTLPFLATALQQEDSSIKLQETETATLSTIIADLADFALYGNGCSAPSRSFAAACLHSILVRTDSVTACPCFGLMNKVVMPLIHSTLQQVSKSGASTGRKDIRDLIIKLKEALSFMGLLGSAAACRGGSSAKTADKIVSILIDLASGRATNEEFSIQSDTPAKIDLTVFDQYRKGSSTNLEVGAASAFGSILSCGGADSLWKQRIGFIGGNRLHANMANGPAKPSIGAVCVSAHLLCSTSNLSSLPSKNGSSTELLTKIVVDSLSPPAGTDTAMASPQCILPTLVKKLVLTAIIKLLCVVPSSMTPSLYSIVVGVMRAYASNVPDDSCCSQSTVERDDTVCKVLALQALETIATVPGAPKDLLGTVKPAVVAILGAAMNEKSSVLRQAAVEVRNAWFVISTASTAGNGAYSFGTTALAGAAQAV